MSFIKASTASLDLAGTGQPEVWINLDAVAWVAIAGSGSSWVGQLRLVNGDTYQTISYSTQAAAEAAVAELLSAGD